MGTIENIEYRLTANWYYNEAVAKLQFCNSLIIEDCYGVYVSILFPSSKKGIIFSEYKYMDKKVGWPRDQYSGPGGGRYTGPGGGLYTGPGGGKYTGPSGGLYTGPGGGLYTGPGGGLYTGPGGGLYTGPGGGLYTGPSGGLYTGPSGGLYTGPGGGMYTGPCNDHYYSIIPPWDIFIQELLKRGLKNYVDIILKYYKYGIEKQSHSAFNNTGRRNNMAVYVANAPGEDYDSERLSGYDSWSDYWNKKRYP
jgi:hypothetical protein